MPGRYWRSEDIDFSENMEQLFEDVMVRIGAQKVDRREVGKEQADYAIARATKDEDENEGTDFWIYTPKRKEWVRVNITTSSDPGILEHKAKHIRRGGKVLSIPPYILGPASLGAENQLNEIIRRVGLTLHTDEKIIV